MPIDFPSSPTTGQVYTYLGKSWVYNGTGWDAPRALSEIGAVQTFANATARTAAIPSPTEGIYTHLNDVDRLEFYNGSAWRPSSGLVLISETPFTAATNVQINNVFSSTFESYKIILNVTSAGNAPIRVGFRFSNGGTPNSSSNYQYGNIYMGAARSLAIGGNNNSTEPSWPFFFAEGGRGGVMDATVVDPFLSATTKVTGVGTGSYLWLFGGMMTVTTSYDGFNFFPDMSNITGQVRVYGIRN